MQGFLRSSKSCTEMHKYTLYGRRITSGFPAFLCDTFMKIALVKYTSIEYDGVSHSLIVESKYSMDIFEEN